MKKIYKPVLIFCAAFLFLGMNSCDLLEQLFLNLALKETITAVGSDDIIGTASDCLSNYEAYNDNKDDIKEIKYVSAAFRTLDSTPSNLGGDSLSTTLYDCDGNIILEQTLPTAVASAYINDPYELLLTQAQIDNLNQYFANHNTCNCFTAELKVKQVTPTGETFYSLTGVVEIIVEIEAKI